MMYGMDISVWQGNIDIAKHKPEFVIIRAGVGRSLDGKAARNMDECERLGIPYGVYWYSYALNVDDAKAEAAACLEAIKGRRISVGVWYDMEDADGYKARNGAMRKSLIGAMSYAFCEIIEAAGYYAGIYAALSWLKEGWFPDCERFDKWVACWGTNSGQRNTDTSAYGTLHQYAGDITRHGDRIDLDVCYADLSRYQTGTAPEPKPTLPIFWPPRALDKGMTGQDVSVMQALLQARGYYTAGITGTVDETTDEAIRAFQKDAGLTEDGVCGPLTWAALVKINT